MQENKTSIFYVHVSIKSLIILRTKNIFLNSYSLLIPTAIDLSVEDIMNFNDIHYKNNNLPPVPKTYIPEEDKYLTESLTVENIICIFSGSPSYFNLKLLHF